MDKDLYIETHEELVAEFLEANPGVSWDVAYEQTAQHVNDRIIDKYSAMVDYWRMSMGDQA